VFNEEVEKSHNRSLELIKFSEARLVGSLGAIILVAAMLKYAELNLEPFLITSAIFWLFDFAGNAEGNKMYKEHKNLMTWCERNAPGIEILHRPFWLILLLGGRPVYYGSLCCAGAGGSTT